MGNGGWGGRGINGVRVSSGEMSGAVPLVSGWMVVSAEIVSVGARKGEVGSCAHSGAG
jgi:hypothetical protein